MSRHRSVLAGLLALLVYVALCPPVPGMGDSSEFDLVLATNGVAHPTGYPLYTLFGHLFCVVLHALGAPWPLAANLLSALGAAVAVGFLYALGVELVATWEPGPPRASAAPARAGASRRLPARTAYAAAAIVATSVPVLLFAFQPVLMDEAVVAEVNSWSVAWTCATAFAFVRLFALIAGAGPTGARLGRAAALWGLLCGSGLAHHLTSVLVSVPLSGALLVALARRRWLAPGLLVVAVAAALLPLSSYGVIAWRAWHPARFQWPLLEPGAASVLAHVTGAQYRHFLGHFAPAASERESILRVVVPFVVPGLVFLAWGVARSKVGPWRIAWSGLLAAAGLVTAFAFSYGVPDPAPYFLPAMALAAAAAVPPAVALCRSRRGGGMLRAAALGLAALALIVPWVGAGVRSREGCVAAESMIRSMWSAVPADSAIVFWPDDRFVRLQEYQLLGGEKPGVYVLMPDMLLERRTRADFVARFGIDPAEGLAVPDAPPRDPGSRNPALPSLNALVASVNDRVRVPVIIFDPAVPVVRQLRKPANGAQAPRLVRGGAVGTVPIQNQDPAPHPVR